MCPSAAHAHFELPREDKLRIRLSLSDILYCCACTHPLSSLSVSSSHLSLSPLFIRRGGLRPRQEDNIQPVQLHALLVSFEAAEITAAAAQAFYRWPYTCRTGGCLANVSAERPATALSRRCCALVVLCHCLHVLALQFRKILQQAHSIGKMSPKRSLEQSRLLRQSQGKSDCKRGEQ